MKQLGGHCMPSLPASKLVTHVYNNTWDMPTRQPTSWVQLSNEKKKGIYHPSDLLCYDASQYFLFHGGKERREMNHKLLQSEKSHLLRMPANA